MLNDDDDDDDDSDHLLVRTKALNRRTVAALRRRREPLHDQFWHLVPAQQWKSLRFLNILDLMQLAKFWHLALSFHNNLDFGLLAQLAKLTPGQKNLKVN